MAAAGAGHAPPRLPGHLQRLQSAVLHTNHSTARFACLMAVHRLLCMQRLYARPAALMHQVLGERPLPQITPEQQAALSALRRERRLDEILGLPAQPPAAPRGSERSRTTSCLLSPDLVNFSLVPGQASSRLHCIDARSWESAGVYLYGEVGSGKSLIAAMFYDFVDQHVLVPLRRKLHFNSAMLEVGNCSEPWTMCQMHT